MKRVDVSQYQNESKTIRKVYAPEAMELMERNGWKFRIQRFVAENVLKSVLLIILISVLSTLGIKKVFNVDGAVEEIGKGNFEKGFLSFLFEVDEESQWKFKGNHPYFSKLALETEKPIEDLFFYVGNGVGIMRDLIKTRDVQKKCLTECEEIAVGANRNTAQDACEDLFEGRLPTLEELSQLQHSNNPLVLKRFVNRKHYAEHTSSVSPNDSDDYALLIKKSGVDQMISENFITDLVMVNQQIYLDEDVGDGNLKLAFRCAVDVPKGWK